MAKRDLTTIPGRLRVLRDDYALKTNVLSKLLNATEDQIKNWFGGRTKMPSANIALIAEHLKVDPSWILTGKGTSPSNLIVDEPESPFRIGHTGRTSPTNSMVRLRAQIAAIVDELGEGVFEIFEAEGASMKGSVNQGDRLICKMIPVDKMINGHIHVLVVDKPELNQYRVSRIWIKRCETRFAKGYVNCKSDNKETTEPYVTFRLTTNEIKEVWYPMLNITHEFSDPNRDIYDQLDELRSEIEFIKDELSMTNQ